MKRKPKIVHLDLSPNPLSGPLLIACGDIRGGSFTNALDRVTCPECIAATRKRR